MCRNVIDFLGPVAELAKRGNRRGDGEGDEVRARQVG